MSRDFGHLFKKDEGYSVPIPLLDLKLYWSGGDSDFTSYGPDRFVLGVSEDCTYLLDHQRAEAAVDKAASEQGFESVPADNNFDGTWFAFALKGDADLDVDKLLKRIAELITCAGA